MAAFSTRTSCMFHSIELVQHYWEVRGYTQYCENCLNSVWQRLLWLILLCEGTGRWWQCVRSVLWAPVLLPLFSCSHRAQPGLCYSNNYLFLQLNWECSTSPTCCSYVANLYPVMWAAVTAMNPAQHIKSPQESARYTFITCCALR